MPSTQRAAVARSLWPADVRTSGGGRAGWARHATVCVLIACAMLAVMRWWTWAWAPSAVIAILYLMYASLEMAESRSRALREVSTSGPRPDTHSALVARERIGTRILVTLVAGIAAMALVVAALVLGSRGLALGTAMTFGVVVFVGLPTWAALIGGSMPQSGRARDQVPGASPSRITAPTDRMK